MMDIFHDFEQKESVPQEMIAKYRGILPDEILEVWETRGFGTFMDGYMKIINPEAYQEALVDIYPKGNRAIPIMASAFGELYVWEDN